MKRWLSRGASRRSSIISALDFFDYMRRSLSLIATEQPLAHRALTAAVGSMRVRLVANGLSRDVWFEPPEWVISPNGDLVDVEVTFDRDVILDLVDGHLTLAVAIEQERLGLRGVLGRIEAFHAALLIFLEGLVRTSEAPRMLQEYRQG